MTEVITGILTLIGTLAVSWLAHRRSMAEERSKGAKDRREAADARESTLRRMREIDGLRDELKSKDGQIRDLSVGIGELSVELEHAERKSGRLEDRLRAEGLSEQDLAGVITGMAPLGGPEIK